MKFEMLCCGKKRSGQESRAQLHERGPLQILGGVLPVWLSGCRARWVHWLAGGADEDGEANGMEQIALWPPGCRGRESADRQWSDSKSTVAQMAGALELSVYMEWSPACLSATNRA